MDMNRSAMPRKGNVYHCWVFNVAPGQIYDLRANHYPKSQAMFENINIRTTGPCNVIFHSVNNDPIPIWPDEEFLAVSNFKFRKVFIDNDSSNDITVRITIYTKNELPE